MGQQDEYIDVRLRLKDARKFNAELAGSAKATDKFGRQVETTSKKSTLFGRASGVAARGVQSVMRAAKYGAIAVAGLAAVYAKKAVSATVELGKATLALHRNFGLTYADASALAAVAKVRGIANQSLVMGFTALSKATDKATHGGKQQLKMFDRLGVSQKFLAHHGNNFSAVLLKVGDGLGKLHGGTKRQALAAGLLGKGFKDLLPLFSDGSKTLKDQMNLAAKYGATFGTNTAAKLKNFIAAQREMQYATLGLQVQLGRYLIPFLTKLQIGIPKVIYAFEHGHGAVAALRHEFENYIKIGKTVLKLMHEHEKAAEVLVGAFLAYHTVMHGLKIAHILLEPAIMAGRGAMWLYRDSLIVTRVQLVALSVQQKALWVWSKLVAGAIRLWTAAQWLLNIAMTANPIGLIIVAALGLAAVFVYMYIKFKWFRNFVNKYWPLLLASMTMGMSLLVGVIVKNWGTIIRFIKSVPGKISKIGKTMWSGIGSGLKAALNYVISLWNKLDFGIHVRIPKGIPGVGGKGFNVSDVFPDIPMLYRGGMNVGGGLRTVGERGTELEFSAPGSTVVPLPARAQRAVAQAPLDLSGVVSGRSEHHITVPLYVDGKKMAETTLKHVEDAEARA